MEERLQKVLARAGVASRREAEKLIQDGRVTVNGHVVRELGVKVDPVTDEVRVDTVEIERSAAAGEAPRTYLLLNKPKGVVCTVKDPHGRTTVVDLVPPHPGKRLYPVGRLDEDSEGLVLLTNDGELTDRLTHPRFGVPKTYDVRVRGFLRPEDAQRFEAGVWLSEGRTGRSRVRVRRSGRDVSHVAITLTEGRNREIRRAWAKLGFDVLTIRRIRIGKLGGRGLPVGAYRPLTADELQELRDVAAGRGADSDMSDPHPRSGRGPRRSRTGDGVEGREVPRRRRRPGKPDPARPFEPARSHRRDRDDPRRRPGSGGSGGSGGRADRGPDRSRGPRDRGPQRRGGDDRAQGRPSGGAPDDGAIFRGGFRVRERPEGDRAGPARPPGGRPPRGPRGGDRPGGPRPGGPRPGGQGGARGGDRPAGRGPGRGRPGGPGRGPGRGPGGRRPR